MDLEDLRKLVREEITSFDTSKTHIDSGSPDSATAVGGRGTGSLEPVPAPAVHNVRKWEKTCKDCGQPNASYERPTHYCKTCHAPVTKEELNEKTKPCTNCGQTEARPYPEEEE